MKDPVVPIADMTSQEPEMASIEQLTESFIAGLQVDFPSTTSTVFRCATKTRIHKHKSHLYLHAL